MLKRHITAEKKLSSIEKLIGHNKNMTKSNKALLKSIIKSNQIVLDYYWKNLYPKIGLKVRGRLFLKD